MTQLFLIDVQRGDRFSDEFRTQGHVSDCVFFLLVTTLFFGVLEKMTVLYLFLF